VRDIGETPEGLRVLIRRSKTDEEGAGRTLGIPWGQHSETCPIRALRASRHVSGIAAGPLFRAVDRHGRIGTARLSDRGVARVVQRAARRAGLDASGYAGHSLRAGLATAAAAGGASERAIMAQTGHRSLLTVRRYIRAGSLFQENAAAATGL
jgi:integrase